MLPAPRVWIQRMRTCSGDVRARSRTIGLAEDGVSAVEFAVFAPVLFIGLVATADVGLALYERMTMDYVLRAGAQSAMADRGEEEVLKVLQTTAAKNFVLSSEGSTSSTGALTLSAERYCVCSDATDVTVACSMTCSASASIYAYYKLQATMAYDGMILPTMYFSPSLQVQVQ